jgi:hypothetical protein
MSGNDQLPTEEEWDRIGKRKRRRYFPQREVITIIAMIIMLVAVLTLRKGCAQGVGNLYHQFEVDGGPAVKQKSP